MLVDPVHDDVDPHAGTLPQSFLGGAMPVGSRIRAHRHGPRARHTCSRLRLFGVSQLQNYAYLPILDGHLTHIDSNSKNSYCNAESV